MSTQPDDSVIDEAEETPVLLAGLLVEQLGIPATTVYLYNQKWDIPTTQGLFIEVAQNAFRPYGGGLDFTDGESAGRAALVENQSINVQEVYTITLFSRNAQARRAQISLMLALRSTQAQQLQEKYHFTIGALPLSFVDVSETEASARLNKYAYTFNVLRSYSRQRVVEYFDQFPTSAPLINP